MYPGIGKDLIMIIIGGLGWDLLKDFGRQIIPFLPGLIPSLPPTPPSHYPWPSPAPSSPLLRYPPSHYPWGDAGATPAHRSNGDGKIDASDEIYASLKVLTGEGKMSSLADAGVRSLNVASEAVNENMPPRSAISSSPM